MIRWTKPVKFVFLLPAVFWVLAFTVFPLGYSLYISFHDVERKVVVTGREKVPMFNEAGEPVLKKSGEPRTKTVVHRELQTNFTWNGFASFVRAFGDEEVGSAVKVTAIFVFSRGDRRDRAGVPARLSLPPIHIRATRVANDHDIADFRDSDRGRLPVLYSVLRDWRPARIHGHTMVIAARIGLSYR